jgi:hypothetical protein
MDEETPTLRLLRPQDMAVERLLRGYAIPVLHRIDLNKARRGDESEKRRYIEIVKTLSGSAEKLSLVLTDSQAFDIVADWTPAKVPLTSFSIMMTNYMSYGDLGLFADGVKAIDKLKPGDEVLIAEACNHDRKCDDIATVQIPNRLEARVGGKLKFSFNFGRPFEDDLKRFKLIVHCGACMIDRQKFARRAELARGVKVPITNYGILLAYLKNPDTLKRALKIFIK